MFEILFNKSKETEKIIKRINEFGDIYIGISLRVNAHSVTKKIDFEGFFPEFADIFLIVCLSLLPKLYSGKSGKFEFEGPFELMFEPHDSKILIYLHFEEHEQPEKKFEVEINNFAYGVIKATEEFLYYVFTLRPDLREHKSTREIQDEFKDAKSWYYKTYGEKI